MGKAGSRGRIRPRVRSSARKAAQARGSSLTQQGDLGEAAFAHKAISLGFVVSKPYGQNHPYDFIVEGGGDLWRVQVKACKRMVHGLYPAGICHQKNSVKVAYAESDVDFVAIYIIPEEIWYVLPVREVVGRMALRFRPHGHSRRDRHAHYREAWHLLRQPDGLTFG
jgi:hypothetical protein